MNTISQLLIADEGYESSGVTGNLDAIYERKEGIGKNDKPWSIQSGKISDSSGNSIKVKIWNMPEFKDTGGITILPTDSGKGPKGLTVKDNEWKGKVTKELHIGDKARISWGESGEVKEEEPANATETTAENSQTIPSTTSTLPSSVIQKINVMDICIQVENILRQKYHDMTDDQFQAICSCFFIEGNKSGLNKNMPSTLL